MKPYTIVSQPIKSRTKEGIVEIEIDGLWYEVSASSIVDGVYRQGYDSNFIVNCLTFKNESKDEDIKKTKINTKKSNK